MTNITTLKNQNVEHLEQALDLLDSLNDDMYTSVAAPNHESCVGDHLRHCLDHYTSFLVGYDAGEVDYDARERDQHIAANRAAAKGTIQVLIQRLNSLPPGDKPLRVKMDCPKNSDDPDSWSLSSVRRELQYLLAHSVHHYALMAVLLGFGGFATNARFGVAASTLRHRGQRLAANGRRCS